MSAATREVVFIQGYSDRILESCGECKSCGVWTYYQGQSHLLPGSPLLCQECWGEVLQRGHVPWHPTRIRSIAARRR